MALKKRKKSKSSTRKQLYMLEILIDSVSLCPQKTANGKQCDMMVRIGFIDLAPVDMIFRKCVEVKSETGKNEHNCFLSENVRYKGKTCLFVQTPSNLMQSLKSTPLSVEVYRIPRSSKDANLGANAEQVLLCAATAFPPESFCDRVAEAKDQIDGLSKPHTVMELYTLSDEQGNACGSMSTYLRLSCFGSSIIDHLMLREKSYVFQGFPLDWKVCCAKLRDKEAKKTPGIKDEQSVLFDKILHSVCSKSRDQKNLTPDADFVLTRPKSPPRVSMDQAEKFARLTSAEKLNDRKFRTLIYGMYPNEPTCSCLPTNRSTHPMMCRSGCIRACCLNLRNPDILGLRKNNAGSSLPVLTDPANDSEAEAEKDTGTSRMRGGGCRQGSKDDQALWKVEQKDILTNRLMSKSDQSTRLVYSSPDATAATVLYERDKDLNPGAIRSSYKSNPGNEGNFGCVCSGKTLPWKPTKCTKCSRSACVGADCLIRAFKEAQEFVDSLGKVPGMMGLGLMDPSESPYFGRDIDKHYVETPREKKPPPSLTTVPPCSTALIDKPVLSCVPVPYTSAYHATVPSIVREAIPEPTLLPIAVKPKKEEKEDVTVPEDEVGPCGESKCKSRRKVCDEKNEKDEVLQKHVSLKPKKQPRHLKKIGPAGDLDRMPIKISKRVMRYVYTIGDVYPGIHYGHKNCIDPRFRVPANMGWLWNIKGTVGKLKPRIGWRPGAISRYVNELLKEAKSATVMEESKSSLRMTPVRRKIYKTQSYAMQVQPKTEEVELPPTLHIHRKDGTYYVTMYPIKSEQPTQDIPQLEEPTKPLQFKIVKNKDDASDASSSTASDMEIEFSPPAAVSRYRKKPDVIHVDTQVKQHEILEALKLIEPPKKKKSKRDKKKKQRSAVEVPWTESVDEVPKKKRVSPSRS
ncbi:hypothetical protein HN011_001257 [Eciton burchellii]|nr:hypothetical protein HN011_001257 [Eciton burchellii]